VSFKVNIAKHQNGVYEIAFSGKITGAEELLEVTDQLEDWLEEADFRGVVAELSELTHMNSTGINLMIRMLTKLRNKGKELILAAPSAGVQQLVTITKLNSIFTIYASREEALNKFNAQEA
jgi:anti-sigma B factor antagonist